MTDLIKGCSISTSDPVTRAQSAALCWRRHRGELQVLLVTSRETGRWVIPKGWPISGLTAAETATREALEEAGVIGKIHPEALGTYGYDKVLDRDTAQVQSLPCSVSVFALRVRELRGRYREVALRKRKWFAQQDAAAKVDEADLQALIAHFDPERRLSGVVQTAAAGE